MRAGQLVSVVGLAVGECVRRPLDLVFLQDATATFHYTIPRLNAVFEETTSVLQATMPEVRFALSTFQDKPWSLLGTLDDECYMPLVPLTDDVKTFHKTYNDIFANGGADTPEAQLEALVDAVRTVEWRDRWYRRIVVLITDDTPHDTDDYIIYNGKYNPAWPIPENHPPDYMTPYPDDPDSDVPPETLCRDYEYPSDLQVLRVLKKNGVEVVTMLPDTVEDRVLSRWTELNEFFGQDPQMVTSYKDANGDNDLLDLLQRIGVLDCDDTTTDDADTSSDDTTTGDAETSTSKDKPVTSTEAPTSTSKDMPVTSTEAPTSTSKDMPVTPTTSTEAPTSTSKDKPVTQTTTLPECSTTSEPECISRTTTKACVPKTTYECAPQTVPGECEERAAAQPLMRRPHVALLRLPL